MLFPGKSGRFLGTIFQTAQDLLRKRTVLLSMENLFEAGWTIEKKVKKKTAGSKAKRRK